MKKICIFILVLAIIVLCRVGIGFKSSDYSREGIFDVIIDKFTGEDIISKEQDMEEQGSINYENYRYINIGDSFESVKNNIGEPTTMEYSEYDFMWYTYIDDYSRFFMVGVYEDVVVALFSNTMDSEETDILLGSTRRDVKKKYTPEKARVIGDISYLVNEEYYDIIKHGSNYITVFYDSFEDDKVIGIQIVSKTMENKLSNIYTTNQKAIYSLENINRYVLNSERVKRKLSTLSYNEQTTLCARAHSQDMKDNNFFSHDNLMGQSPFDRMDTYGINYTAAAENIAAGQTSPIFMHYALLNSEGHRVNMLDYYTNIGVGVAIGGEMNLYLTQNFFR